jgi:5'-nucleotidase
MEDLKKLSRASFLRLSGLTAGSLLLSQIPLDVWGADDEETKVTILHTNDWHSRIEPFPMDGSRNQGLGGAAARAAMIRKIRAEEKHVLLLDAGDIVQGTPYFNFFAGEPEIKLMNEMKYDAVTIGNHDFDNGLTGLQHMVKSAEFPFLSANYDFNNTLLQHLVRPYKVFTFDKVKIGVFGVGISPDELIPRNLFGDTIYSDAIRVANQCAGELKSDFGCDMVICLSHLGYQYSTQKLSDEVLARASENIDLIIGGHTHTFLEKPSEFLNKKNKPVWVNQVGWAGLKLGRLDWHFRKKRAKFFASSASVKKIEKSI